MNIQLSERMAWAVLVLSGFLEVLWSTALAHSQGFTRPGATALAIGAMLASFVGLSLAMTRIPLGTAYAVWTGIGVLGAVSYGILVLGEPRTTWRLLFLTTLLISIVGLKLKG